MGNARHILVLTSAAALMVALGVVTTRAQGSAYRSSYAPLSGTYQLDRARSDDPSRIADQATQSMNATDRDRVHRNLLARMDAPDTIAIDVRGRDVTLASSTGPRVTFQADGRNRTETGPNGRPMTTRADLNGDAVVVSTSGNRGSDYTVTFDPTPDGLRVTRQLDNDVMNTTVTSHSVYRRISADPRWTVYDDARRGPGNPGYGEPRRDIVPAGTELRARLDTPLSTSDAREGQRFQMTVVSAGPYNGATLDGIVAGTSSGNGHANIVFDFDSIRLRNGQSGPFEGAIQAVRKPDGTSIRVDQSGAVRDQSRGANVPDTALGATLGAIVGAIAGGGKGAAIGAVAGGAGTAIVEGQNELNLPAGSEITIAAIPSEGRVAPLGH